MSWMEAIGNAIQYIETHITEKLTADEVAAHVGLSSFYFQKGFAMLCGFTLGEYVRNRRLALAGNDLATGSEKIIDIAMKYGYDSPDSFTKAFTRFHSVTPTAARKDRVMLKSFAPLKIKLSLEGGYLMDYRMEKKAAFTVIGRAKTFPYEGAKQAVPLFWQEHFASGGGSVVCGKYGVNIDARMGCDSFEYMIADDYNPVQPVPDGFVTQIIPTLTWAVFPCVGPLPQALQDVNTKIFTEWLPALHDYEFSDGYCIEMYDDPHKFPQGTMDERYYSEIWLPVKKSERSARGTATEEKV